MPPTLTELRESVARDVRDPLMRTFTFDHLDDLINGGQNELNHVRPPEKIQTIVVLAATYSYATTLQEVWRVEGWRSGAYYAPIQEADPDESQSGWQLYAGQLHFLKAMIDTMVPATDTLRAWGYGTFVRLTTGAQVSELDEMAEWAVRRYAMATAFELLHHDRALFKQWQAQSNNSDTTNNQLSQMAGQYKADWVRTRGNIRRLRRT